MNIQKDQLRLLETARRAVAPGRVVEVARQSQLANISINPHRLDYLRRQGNGVDYALRADRNCDRVALNIHAVNPTNFPVPAGLGAPNKHGSLALLLLESV